MTFSETIPNASEHIPVLLQPVLDGLLGNVGQQLAAYSDQSLLWVDGTVGLGGHSFALLRHLQAAYPEQRFRLFASDQDKDALEKAQLALAGFKGQVQWQQAPFSETEQCLAHHQLGLITGGLLVDLGVSSLQLDKAERGFSFRQDAPLDMRMNASDSSPQPAAWELLQSWSEQELADCLHQYGEERLARPIARAVYQKLADEGISALQTTRALAVVIEAVYKRYGLWPARGKKREKQPIRPATRSFQALRIAVNDELGELERLLEQLPRITAKGARVALISFHSLEDRLIKQWFKTASLSCICPSGFPVCKCDHVATFRAITRKPVVADSEEMQSNPRSRSAKLRVYERL